MIDRRFFGRIQMSQQRIEAGIARDHHELGLRRPGEALPQVAGDVRVERIGAVALDSDARMGGESRQVELLDVFEVDQDDLFFHYHWAPWGVAALSKDILS
ncbi:MAG: hypothetical protein WD051_11025 [Steroidobacteraceae bacterium]